MKDSKLVLYVKKDPPPNLPRGRTLMDHNGIATVELDGGGGGSAGIIPNTFNLNNPRDAGAVTTTLKPPGWDKSSYLTK